MKQIIFTNPAINFYAEDIEVVSRFYVDHFGFVETFRTPQQGKAIHIEIKLRSRTLGFASREVGKVEHGLPLEAGGSPRAELVVRTEDVDEAYAMLVEEGVPGISAPHDILPSLRAAWVTDPEGNPVRIVSRRVM